MPVDIVVFIRVSGKDLIAGHIVAAHFLHLLFADADDAEQTACTVLSSCRLDRRLFRNGKERSVRAVFRDFRHQEFIVLQRDEQLHAFVFIDHSSLALRQERQVVNHDFVSIGRSTRSFGKYTGTESAREYNRQDDTKQFLHSCFLLLSRLFCL